MAIISTTSQASFGPGKRRINLGLMYTCKSVAAEMHHLALRSNVLHFTTLDTEPRKAARFDMFFSRVQVCRSETLRSLKARTLRRYKTPEVDAKLALRFPQFQSLLRQPLEHSSCIHPDFSVDFNISNDIMCCSWGEARSVFRAFQGYMIELLTSGTDFLEALANFYDVPEEIDDSYINNADHLDQDSQAWRDAQQEIFAKHEQLHGRESLSFLRSVPLLSVPEPWTIPSKDEFAQMDKILGQSLYEVRTSFNSYTANLACWERVRWRFSAAAVAIHFFKSITQSTCLGIRNVVLHEDRDSVAQPDCHALGLIPFCLQNPHLHIERRVNIWRSLLVGRFREGIHEFALKLEDLSGRDEGETLRWRTYNKYGLGAISRKCCRWITEASALSASGMPPGSFSLVLDGSTAPDQSSTVFEVIKDDAAWQVANAQWFTDHSMFLDPMDLGSPSSLAQPVYYSKVFPQAIKDIVERKSFIRCNFDTGNMVDANQILDRNRHVPGRRWIRNWFEHRFRNPIQSAPPLPPVLVDLALEDLMPEEQQQHTA